MYISSTNDRKTKLCHHSLLSLVDTKHVHVQTPTTTTHEARLAKYQYNTQGCTQHTGFIGNRGSLSLYLRCRCLPVLRDDFGGHCIVLEEEVGEGVADPRAPLGWTNPQQLVTSILQNHNVTYTTQTHATQIVYILVPRSK